MFLLIIKRITKSIAKNRRLLINTVLINGTCELILLGYLLAWHGVGFLTIGLKLSLPPTLV